jgi:RNA methyltransferase, TrmH family
LVQQFKLVTKSKAELSDNSALLLKAQKLLQKKFRLRDNLFLVEGVSTIIEGLNANKVHHIFFSKNYKDQRELFKIADKFEVKSYLVSEKAIKTLSDTKNPVEVIAVADSPVQPLSIDKCENFEKVIFLDSVRDPGNAGTVIRGAAAFGMDAVCFSSDSVDPTNPKTIRATTGSIFQIPIFHAANLDLFEEIGFEIYLTALDGELDLTQVPTDGKQIWVFSNEAHGVSDFKKPLKKVKISIKPETESLNVAQAATVIMFYLSNKI